jgi:hypothetical protein
MEGVMSESISLLKTAAKQERKKKGKSQVDYRSESSQDVQNCSHLRAIRL